jgi:Fuc2NAc and GlcNAc transferase
MVFKTGIIPFFISFCSAFVISRIGSRISLIDNPNERSSHSQPTPRGGGIGIWLSFMVVPFFLLPTSSFRFIEFAVVASLVGLFGLVEDRFNLSSKLRLAIQLSLSSVTVYLFIIPLTTFSSLLTFLFWVVFITGTSNFYNFMDGINGIAGLTGIVGFGLITFFSYFITNEPDIALMSISLVSACLGFLPFNFPKARVFMGDVGSVSLGFLFAFFVIKLSATINIFLCSIMFLYTFYADALVTIYYRWRQGENLMKAHRSHLYQYMANELRLAHWKVTIIYAIAQLIVGFLSIVAFKNGLTWQVILFVMLGIVVLNVYNKVKKLKPASAKINGR